MCAIRNITNVVTGDEMTNSNNRRMCVANHFEQGFSIVELMVAISVAAILLAVALPSFKDVNRNSNVTQITNQLIGDINTARSEAVRRGTLVGVIANGGDWNTGWYIETDGDFKANGTFAAVPVTAGNDVVLATRGAVPIGGYSVGAAAGAGASTQIIFTAQGTLYKAGTFDINVCRPDAMPARSKHISISSSGITGSYTDTTSSPAPAC
jgi:type IV fimbrial biogenesis protein FimT